MDEQQLQQQIVQLVQAAMQGDQQATQQIQQIMQAAQQGDQQAAQIAQMIQAVAQQMQQQQVQAAKFGAKLNYIRQLRGVCPEGQELEYYRDGGRLCKKCVQKHKMQDGGEVPSNPVDAFKCGRKMRKKKKENGGSIEMDKCGRKMKKKACGGNIKKAQSGADSDTFRDTSTGTTRTTKKGNITREIRYKNNAGKTSWGNDTTYIVDTGVGLPLRFSNMFNTDYGTDRRGYQQVQDAFDGRMTPVSSSGNPNNSPNPEQQSVFKQFIQKHTIR